MTSPATMLAMNLCHSGDQAAHRAPWTDMPRNAGLVAFSASYHWALRRFRLTVRHAVDRLLVPACGHLVDDLQAVLLVPLLPDFDKAVL